LAEESYRAEEEPAPVAMLNRANLKRFSMDVLVNLLLSHETSESYKKLIEEELENRRPKGTWNR
jgi:hypothetical protein